MSFKHHHHHGNLHHHDDHMLIQPNSITTTTSASSTISASSNNSKKPMMVNELTTSTHNNSHHHHHQPRNVFVVKSLGVIVAFTLIVLGVNYYLISNCPNQDSNEGVVAAAAGVIDEHHGIVSVGEETNHLGDDGGGVTIPKQQPLVTISVYYEILCPDSKHFILKQLVPVFRKYGPDILRVRFVPFGKATVTPVDAKETEFKFSCQHGPEECHGNKLHACVVESFPRNETLQLEIIACSMEKFRLWGANIQHITEVVRECRVKYAPPTIAGTDNELLCENANKLLASHGYETLALRPRVSFIPTVTIDHSTSDQAKILRDLDGVVCAAVKKKKSFDC